MQLLISIIFQLLIILSIWNYLLTRICFVDCDLSCIHFECLIRLLLPFQIAYPATVYAAIVWNRMNLTYPVILISLNWFRWLAKCVPMKISMKIIANAFAAMILLNIYRWDVDSHIYHHKVNVPAIFSSINVSQLHCQISVLSVRHLKHLRNIENERERESGQQTVNGDPKGADARRCKQLVLHKVLTQLLFKHKIY